LAGPDISFEEWPPSQRPKHETVKKVLDVRALGVNTFTLLVGSDSYLTGWHADIVADVDWVLDDNRVERVTRLRLRLREKGETFFFFRPEPRGTRHTPGG